MENMINGFVLHSRPYRETSALIDLFTEQLGKVSVVAKGIRGKKSAKKSMLQIFQPLQFMLSGRGELKNLGHVETYRKAYMLSGDALFSAMYLNELLNRLLSKEFPYPEIYELYCRTLNDLAKHEIEPLLREFEFGLLNALGYGIDFSADWQLERAIVGSNYYAYMPEHGWQLLDANHQHTNCFSGDDLIAIANLDWQPKSLMAAKKITRIALHPLLGSKPLKSRELFSSVIRMEQP
jgi:DNA repair protein RecO (recombination protein O)